MRGWRGVVRLERVGINESEETDSLSASSKPFDPPYPRRGSKQQRGEEGCVDVDVCKEAEGAQGRVEEPRVQPLN